MTRENKFFISDFLQGFHRGGDIFRAVLETLERGSKKLLFDKRDYARPSIIESEKVVSGRVCRLRYGCHELPFEKLIGHTVNMNDDRLCWLFGFYQASVKLKMIRRLKRKDVPHHRKVCYALGAFIP